MVRKLSQREFSEMLADPDVEDERIAPYLIALPGERGFAPKFAPNPDLVERDRAESALTIGNWLCRRRRRNRFNRRLDQGVELPVLVSEGDSWFQFPFIIKDVIDHLEDDYLIWSSGASGDTADNMILENPEYLEALDEQGDRVSGFLLSAAGNDVIGQDANGVPVLSGLLHRRSDRRRTAAQLINKTALCRVLDKLQTSYLHVVSSVRDDPRFEELPIIFHGYDYALPFPASENDRRSPFWAGKNEWLGAPMTEKGISDPAVRREIVEILIAELYDMLNAVAATDAYVHVVDVRGTLSVTADWADEIHGTSAGFNKVAGKFRKLLSRVVVPKRPNMEAMTADASESPVAVFKTIEQPSLNIETKIDRGIDPERLGFGDMEKFANGFRRTKEAVSRLAVAEAQIMEDDSVPFRFLCKGAERGNAVCKIEASGVNYLGGSGTWSGTGFLIAPNILLTNHHVINSREVAEQSRAVFSFEETAPGVHAATSTFKFDPGRLFISSPFGELDYCFVWIDGAPHEQFGTIEFWRGSFMAAPGAPANIIHHPKGLPKRASLEKNKIVDLGFAEVLVHYSSDTERGSSGSPVLNDDWRLFALHHASTRELKGPKRDLLEKEDIEGDILNEGIKTAAIAIDIDRRVNVGPDQMMARQVQAHISGSDSRTGFFGTLGRHGQGSNGMEIVVDTYQGAAGDIDIAFWNVEWFNRDFERKVNDVARIVADLNLDIWAFEETSPEATEALVRKMRREFGLDFEFAASEPNASSGKQTTTVMWNVRTVNGGRMEWPAEIDTLMKLRSDDPEAMQFEAVDGKIFNRYPGLFRFELRNPSPNQQQFDFNLVPVHLKAKAEGAKRRRMASNLLAAAIQMMTREAGSETDWVIGGDVNAELSTGQFDGLGDAGFTAMSALDEQGGAITYLGARFRSLIDSIFLSPGLSRGVGADDFMIIAAERDDPGFIDRVSDHRPVMVRLSLGDAPAADDVSGGGSARAALEEDDNLLNEFLNELRGDPAGTLEGLAELLRNK